MRQTNSVPDGLPTGGMAGDGRKRTSFDLNDADHVTTAGQILSSYWNPSIYFTAEELLFSMPYIDHNK